jgi:PAS domain S-box-containing protein
MTSAFARVRAWTALLGGGLLLLVALQAMAGERVRVGVYENSPKIALSPTGEPEGIFIDLIEAIARKEGWTVEYVPGTWQQGLDRLAAGEIDLMPDVARTAERERLYAFHDEPALSSWSQVYARRDSGIRALPDLAGRRVAVLEGSAQEEEFRGMVKGFGLAVELLPKPDFAAAFHAVTRGEADAVVTNRFYGTRNASRLGLQDTAVIFAPARLYFAAPKGTDPARLAAIDRQLLALKQDVTSVYFRSLRNWSGEEASPGLPRWLAGTAAALVTLLVAATLLAAAMRRQVNARTAQLRQRTEQMAILNRTLRAVGSSLDLQTVLDEATRGTLELTGCDGGVLCVREPQQGVMRVEARIRACAETDRAPDGGPLRDAACPAMLEGVMRGRRHVVLRRGAPGVPRPCGNVVDETVRWNIYFALESQGNAVGLLCLFSRQEEPPAEPVLELVQELCVPVALAMENARLYAQARQHAQELENRVEVRTRELAETTHFLDTLIDRMPNPVFYMGPDLRHLGCNRAYEEAFGLSRAQIIGKTVLELDFLDVADQRALYARDKALLESGASVFEEATTRFADGKTHPILYSIGAFRHTDGSPGGLVGVITDIARLKETEAALIEAKHAAESADRLKSAFLATMSHELRTPLNSIIGFTGILLQQLAGPLNPEQHKQLGMVQNSSRHLLALINDVLDISKIEAGELTVASDPLDLAASITKVVGIVAPLAEGKGLALHVEGMEHAGRMTGDARRVEQILLNLLSNAIKFTERGSVTLSVDTTDEGGAVRLHVQDTGIGIKPEDMTQLFQPFRQLDSALTRAHEGTGLGLAICRRLAALMGGSIEASSRPGEGSTFTAILPLAGRRP